MYYTYLLMRISYYAYAYGFDRASALITYLQWDCLFSADVISTYEREMCFRKVYIKQCATLWFNYHIENVKTKIRVRPIPIYTNGKHSLEENNFRKIWLNNVTNA